MNWPNRRLKQKIHSHFLQLATDKVQLLQKRLDDLRESGANETKSTAGDKHETALAMIQIEQANIRKQLEEALAQLTFLQKLNPAISSTLSERAGMRSTEKITNGSLVKTNKGYFYVSVALGKINIDGAEIIALSMLSPLGKKLLGLKLGDKFELNNNSYTVQNIV
jgi:transcription elongation GreA/GreB family factor